jgi:hypothetical protein
MLCIATSGSLSRISFPPNQSVVRKFALHTFTRRESVYRFTSPHVMQRLGWKLIFFFSILWRSLETAAAAAHAVRIHMDVDTDVAALVSGRAAASVRRRRRRDRHHYHYHHRSSWACMPVLPCRMAHYAPQSPNAVPKLLRVIVNHAHASCDRCCLPLPPPLRSPPCLRSPSLLSAESASPVPRVRAAVARRFERSIWVRIVLAR